MQANFNKMRKLKEFINEHKGKVNKYYLTIAIFVVFTFFVGVGDSTIYQRFLYYKKINELRSEISKYQQEIKENTAKLNSLRMDDESLERYAREQFLMTKSDEDLYIIAP